MKAKLFRINWLGALLMLPLVFGSISLQPIQSAEAVEIQGERINVNEANLEELQEVKGVGPLLAERIVTYRNEHGLFEQTDDLANVRGIGGAKLQKIKTQISL